MKRIPYSSEELENIVELIQEEMPVKDIVRLVNDIYHNEKPVRTKRAIRYLASKLNIQGEI